MKNKTRELIDILDGPVAVSKMCGITHSAVCQWEYIPSRFLFTLIHAAKEKGRIVNPLDCVPQKPAQKKRGSRQNPD